MLNAEIVTGISLMLVFLVIGNFLSRFDRELPFGFWTVLIGHITFNIPYTILSIMPKLRQTSRYTYEEMCIRDSPRSVPGWFPGNNRKTA